MSVFVLKLFYGISVVVLVLRMDEIKRLLLFYVYMLCDSQKYIVLPSQLYNKDPAPYLVREPIGN